MITDAGGDTTIAIVGFPATRPREDLWE